MPQPTVDYQVAVQVRLGSRRLPRKALLELSAGRCVLSWVLHHLRQSQRVQRFVLLCPKQDCEQLWPYAQHYGFELFGGSEHDVLHRFIEALRHYPARYCFRATADNPLVTGSQLDFMAEQAERAAPQPAADYYWIRGLPYGLAAELLRSEALLELEQRLIQPADREHVTRFFYTHPQHYRLRYDEAAELLGNEFGRTSHLAHLAKLRLTLDTPEDYIYLQGVFAALERQGELAGQRLEFRQLLLALRQL